MSKLKDTLNLLDVINKQANKIPEGTIDQITAFNLGAISSFLGDIALSLAIIADKMREEA